jgi:PAS domain S-box-containing protein
LAVVDPAKIRRNDVVPPVYVEAAFLDGKPLPLAGGLAVPAGGERLELRFTALSLLDPSGVRFRYRLEGYETAWVEGAERSAHYTNVPPGEYVFRVVARNADGVWNLDGARLGLRVLPFWHQRASARVLVGALIAAGLLALFRLRVHQLRGRERLLVQRVAQRTQELSSEVAERRRAEEEVRRLNESLEARVRERTSQLEAAMRALESDIARRLAAEGALKAEKERLAVTLRSIGDAVIATDVEGRVLLLNRVAESLTGWTAAEAEGRALREVMPLVARETRAPVADPVRAVVETGRHFELPAQSLLVSREGREFVVADSAAPIRDASSRIIGVVIAFRDVTDKLRVEEQLRNAQKLEALGILAGGLAHDFNNLLTGIFGYIDLARTMRSSTDRVEHNLKSALSVLERARGLTRQLLTFSRAGQPITRPVPLAPLLEGAARFVLSGSAVSAVFDLAPGLWPCQADEQQIDQAVDNLLLNARQAMPDGGTIAIGAANEIVEVGTRLPLAPGRHVRIWIRDQGTGIPHELHTKVFDPFFTTKPSGSGLGLTTTYSIVKKHNGCIELVSEPGSGTTFTLHLPAAAETPAAAGAAEELPVTGEGRILVMDDEEYVRDVAREVLELLGYTVEAVADGDAAIAAFERARRTGAPFDLMILDLTVPGGLGGLATLAQVTAIEPAVRALATSGYSGDAVMADPQGHGFVGGLVKPFTIAELSAAVTAALSPRA